VNVEIADDPELGIAVIALVTLADSATDDLPRNSPSFALAVVGRRSRYISDIEKAPTNRCLSQLQGGAAMTAERARQSN